MKTCQATAEVLPAGSAVPVGDRLLGRGAYYRCLGSPLETVLPMPADEGPAVRPASTLALPLDCTVSSNASSPLSRVIGEGGQPRICKSTGRTAETPPTQA